jgi:hypothetical protein
VHQEEVVASDEDLADLHRRRAVQRLDPDVDQLVLIVRIEHVAQALGVQTEATGQQALLAVGDELDLGQDGRRG